MKKETYEAKLAALLGLETVLEKKKEQTLKSVTNGKYTGVPEAIIQNFRYAQGVIYFLQAPELFTNKTCPHCKDNFLVSRQFVSFCSYTCIKASLHELGIEWKKGDDVERLVAEVYEGNEPIWIKNLDRIREILQ